MDLFYVGRGRCPLCLWGVSARTPKRRWGESHRALQCFVAIPWTDTRPQRNRDMEPIKVVLRYTDGAILKGYTQDFHPESPAFHFHKDSQETSPMEMGVEGLKALFLVRTFGGNPDYRERKEFIEGDKSYGDRVEVTFGDGEVMQGSCVYYHPERPGFFLLPPDPRSNNMLIFVVTAAVKNFRYL